MLQILSYRSPTFARADATRLLLEVLEGHLVWGAFPTPGYSSHRQALQARVQSAIAPILEPTARVHARMHLGAAPHASHRRSSFSWKRQPDEVPN